jgi:uncharacterized glyoxalase superfamily protein PhnB
MAARKSKAGKKKAPKKAAAKRSAPKASRAKTAKKGLSFTMGAPGVTVDDVTATLAWYCDVLGFQIKQKWEQNGTLMGAELLAGDATFYIGQDDWKKGRDRKKGDGVRFYFYVKGPKDIDRYAAEIRRRGATLASEPKDQWGVRSFDLVDPSGYLLTISSEM